MDTRPPTENARMWRYLDGDLPVDEALRFELRLSEEPALEGELQALARFDALQRLAVGGTPLPKTGRGRLLRWFAAAVAAGFVGWMLLGPRLRSEGEALKESVRVAVHATGSTVFTYAERLGLDGAVVPSGGTLRGDLPEAPQGDTVSAAEYVAWLGAPARDRTAEVLQNAEGAIAEVPRAEYFVLPVQTDRALAAVVLLVQPDGQVVGARGEPEALAYPATPSWESVTRLQPGTAVLPHEVLALAKDGDVARVDYRPGFLVPVQSGGLEVLVGLREARLLTQDRDALQETLVASRGTSASERVVRLREALEDRGFHVRSLRVDEP